MRLTLEGRGVVLATAKMAAPPQAAVQRPGGAGWWVRGVVLFLLSAIFLTLSEDFSNFKLQE